MKKFYFLGAALALLIGFAWTESTRAQKGDNLARLMQEKLNHSKMLLEGIALGDFKKINRSAENLIQISKTAEWFVFKTPRFEVHTNEFRRAAENILQKSGTKSLDGVTLAYFELTMSCVRCHEYVREVRDARLPAAKGFGVVAAP